MRYSNEGMTLRDWFAGQALDGMLASETHGRGLAVSPGKDGTLEENTARRAYTFADAMLRARESNAEAESSVGEE